MTRTRPCSVVLLLLVAAGLLAACTDATGGTRPSPPGSTTAAPDEQAGFALALGVDPQDHQVQGRLGRYAIAVVDGTDASAGSVRAIARHGTTVLGYLSVGTLERDRPWTAEARAHGWALDRWERWDEWYADVSQPGMRSLLLAQARAILAKGFDGLFLDNTDMVESHPDQRSAMAQLVADLDRLVGPRRALWAQDGDPVAAGIVDHLDGWNLEDVTYTYDADREQYLPTSPADHHAALAAIHRLASRDLVVTATDYLDPDAPSTPRRADHAVRIACDAGAALAYVADIDLTQVPSTPRTCPEG